MKRFVVSGIYRLRNTVEAAGQLMLLARGFYVATQGFNPHGKAGPGYRKSEIDRPNYKTAFFDFPY